MRKCNKMKRDEGKSSLSAEQEKAALLVADDVLTDEQISAEVGINRVTLYRWKKLPEFAARVDGLLGEIRSSLRRRGIAVVENRVRALQDRWKRMQRVIDERAASEKMATVPGGTTGLLVHNVKSIGAGPTAERVDLFEVDTGLLKELRDHERQAAQELGQWADKQIHTGPDGEALIVKVLRGVSTDEL